MGIYIKGNFKNPYPNCDECIFGEIIECEAMTRREVYDYEVDCPLFEIELDEDCISKKYVPDKAQEWKSTSTDETLREICRNFMGIVEETKVDCKYQGQIDSCGEPFCECEAYAKSISCEYQRFDYNPDGKINIVTCGMIEKEINNE